MDRCALAVLVDVVKENALHLHKLLFGDEGRFIDTGIINRLCKEGKEKVRNCNMILDCCLCSQYVEVLLCQNKMFTHIRHSKNSVHGGSVREPSYPKNQSLVMIHFRSHTSNFLYFGVSWVFLRYSS